MPNDNRIRFDPTEIDFVNDVGLTGQAHDDWPGPDQQARYDWFRSYFIGLLSSQSSNDPPTQFREGTLWFDTTVGVLKIRAEGQWVDLPARTMTDGVNQSTINQLVLGATTSFHPNVTWNGTFSSSNVTSVPVPQDLRNVIDINEQTPVLYVNGLLQDTRNVTFQSKDIIDMNNVTVNVNDRYTVIVMNITPQNVEAESIVA